MNTNENRRYFKKVNGSYREFFALINVKVSNFWSFAIHIAEIWHVRFQAKVFWLYSSCTNRTKVKSLSIMVYKINENLELVIDQIILAIIKRSKDHLHFSKEKRSLLL